MHHIVFFTKKRDIVYYIQFITTDLPLSILDRVVLHATEGTEQ